MALQMHAFQAGDGAKEGQVKFHGFADVLRVGEELLEVVVFGRGVFVVYVWSVLGWREEKRRDGIRTTAALSSHFALLKVS